MTRVPSLLRRKTITCSNYSSWPLFAVVLIANGSRKSSSDSRPRRVVYCRSSVVPGLKVGTGGVRRTPPHAAALQRLRLPEHLANTGARVLDPAHAPAAGATAAAHGPTHHGV